MRFQELVNPFCEEVENAFSQPNPGIQEIAGNLRLKHKKNVSCKLLCWVLNQLRELNPPSESESEKHVSSRSCISLYQGEWEQTRYWEITASKTKTELPNRTVFNVCIQLTEVNWCVFAAVCKPFLWRSINLIFQANSKHLRNSCKCPSETRNDHVFQTALLCVCSTEGARSAVSYIEWVAHFF